MTYCQEHPNRTVMRVRPFRGIRYTGLAGDLGDVTFTPPTAWASVPDDELTRLGPHHVMRLLSPAFDPHLQSGAEESRDRLEEWLATDIVRRDEDPALYVYARDSGERSFVGLVGAVDLGAPSDRALLDHEEVIPALVETQARLEHVTQAQIEPIFALHSGSMPLRTVLDEVMASAADMTIADDTAVRHRLWRVTDPTRQRDILAAIPDEPAVIADGHHRHAAWASAVTPSDGARDHLALTLLADSEQDGLRVGAIHRVIDGLDVDAVLSSELVHSVELDDRDEALGYLDSGPIARCVLYTGGTFHALTPTGESPLCATPELAVCHLHSDWLPRWGIADADVDYVHGADAAIALAGTSGAAVLLPVTPMDEVVRAARGGRLLPRKATSFGPKPLVGGVFRQWESQRHGFA